MRGTLPNRSDYEYPLEEDSCVVGPEGVVARLVIQRNTMDYALPILGEFTATSALEQPGHWPRFMRTLARMGKARASVAAVLEAGDQVVGRLTGEFVALIV